MEEGKVSSTMSSSHKIVPGKKNELTRTAETVEALL